VTYMSSGGGTSTKLIEIKPLHEASAAHARSSADVAIRAKNEAKWGAATQWAARRGIDFIVLTEAELYSNHANRKGRAHPIKAVGKEQVRSNKPASRGKTKKQTATNLGTASRAARSQAKARLGGSISRVGKVQKAKRSTKR